MQRQWTSVLMGFYKVEENVRYYLTLLIFLLGENIEAVNLIKRKHKP